MGLSSTRLRSRPSRARGLKRLCGRAGWRARGSRPSRARGLKLQRGDLAGDVVQSRPSRARGLKHDRSRIIGFRTGRALHGRVD